MLKRTTLIITMVAVSIFILVALDVTGNTTDLKLTQDMEVIDGMYGTGIIAKNTTIYKNKVVIKKVFVLQVHGTYKKEVYDIEIALNSNEIRNMIEGFTMLQKMSKTWSKKNNITSEGFGIKKGVYVCAAPKNGSIIYGVVVISGNEKIYTYFDAGSVNTIKTVLKKGAAFIRQQKPQIRPKTDNRTFFDI